MGFCSDPKSAAVTKDIVSPAREGPEFTIRKATNREDVARQNMFSKVRYIAADEDGEMVTERDFPLGDMQIETIRLCLEAWNFEDKAGRSIPITTGNLVVHLLPEERIFLYNEILDFNPVWRGGKDAAKND